jgi:hypothetical protein
MPGPFLGNGCVNTFLQQHERNNRIAVFGNGICSSTRGGVVFFLIRHHICCSVIQYECARTHTTSRLGHLYFMGARHAVSLYRPYVNAGFCSRLCLNLFHYSETAVVGLTTAKFKQFVLPVHDFSVSSLMYI